VKGESSLSAILVAINENPQMIVAQRAGQDKGFSLFTQ